MNAEQTFRAKAPGIMSKLMADFAIGVDGAAAIVGNLGHESLGFTAMQEFNPTVKGSRGGWGWAQWTGPRRVEFEAYCKRTGKDPASDDANYAFLFVELTSTEKRAIPALRAADTLAEKVEAFEGAFLRAGVKHYDSRKQWAKIAKDEWNKTRVVDAGPPIPANLPDPAPDMTQYAPPKAEVDVKPQPDRDPAANARAARLGWPAWVKWACVAAAVVIVGALVLYFHPFS